MPLPTGTWKATTVGSSVDLTINAPDQMGQITGKLGAINFVDFWDEVSQKITFGVTTVDPALGGTAYPAGLGGVNAPLSFAVYTGYLYRSASVAAGQDFTATLAGTMQATKGYVGASSRQNVFGWFAQINEVV